MPTTIFVALRNSLAHEGLCRILEDAKVGAVRPLPDLAALSSSLVRPYDDAILVVEKSLCGSECAFTVRSMLDGFARLRIIVLVDRFDFAEMAAIYQAGAHAYFLLDSPCQSLVAMMQMVAIGQRVAPPQIIDTIVQMPVTTDREAPSSDAAHKLSHREREVLAGLRNGLQNKTIAYDLSVTEAAIKATVKSILTKLGVRNRTQAAVLAREMSLQAPSPSPLPALTAPGMDCAPRALPGDRQYLAAAGSRRDGNARVPSRNVRPDRRACFPSAR